MTRKERRQRKRLVSKCNPEKIITSLEKTVQRDKPKTLWGKIRRLFIKSHSEKVLKYAHEVLQK